jgi:SAM-dependent methyltransferase
MTLRTLKRAVRRIGNRLGLREQQAKPSEASEAYYDAAFSNDPHYHVPFYKSSYYPTWAVVIDRLRRYGCRKILDVGCGPGQFAEVVADAGFTSYSGLDFSTVAIDMAQQRTPQFDFQVADVCRPDSYAGRDFDAIVCMEVLEHIEDDYAVVSCFPAGTRCLMTVPNFPWRSHVRHFESEQSVTRRYASFFDEFSVTRLKGMRNETEQFYLIDGVRNSAVGREAGAAEAS